MNKIMTILVAILGVFITTLVIGIGFMAAVRVIQWIF